MFLAKISVACALLVAASAPVKAACPSSVMVGTPDYPNEIAFALRDDAAFAKTHLNNINRLLPLARESCQKGVSNNCRLANFLAEAKSGLECYAGVAGDTASQMHSGNARDMAQTGKNAGNKSTANNEICRCGPDYVQCFARSAQRSGHRYSISTDGRGIVIYNSDGSWGTKKGIEDDGTCSAVVR